MTPFLTVLGGGPAGLAVGYYARKAGLPFTIFEASPRPGGNCITFEQDGFRFDSGAHRFHDKDPEITREVQYLIGADFHPVNIPSLIYHNGKLIRFPLAPFNLLQRLGPRTFGKVVWEVLYANLGKNGKKRSFESLAISRYGPSLAEWFLLNYSEKLWGAPCSHLSPEISGKRLQGLDIRTFVLEAFGGTFAGRRHLEGSFYYPRLGFGEIAQALAGACGKESIRCSSKVSRIHHIGTAITSIEVNGGETLPVEEIINTLPVSLFLNLLSPAPPEEVLAPIRNIRYRNVVLAVFFLDKPTVTNAATVYFPDRSFPFSRAYEPRNRSPFMAPEGKTSIVVEIPCQQEDAVWTQNEEALLERIQPLLEGVGWFRPGEVLGTAVRHLPFAYPILELDFEKHLEPALAWLSRFSNLRSSGRNGLFRYTWMHDMLHYGKEIVAEYVNSASLAG